MKIAYVCTDNGVPVLGNKGSSVHVREFTDALVDLGHQVRIYATQAMAKDGPVLTGNSSHAPLTILAPSEPTRNAARLITASLARCNPTKDHTHLFSEVLQILTEPDFVHAASLLLQDWQPELIISRHTLFSSAGLTLAHSLGCPLVLEVNAPLVEERRRYWNLVLVPEAEQSEYTALPEADLLVAVSEGVRTYLLRMGVPDERILIQPNGVNLAVFNPEVDGTAIRRFYGLENKLVVGFSGSLKPWHGVDMLLRAFADLCNILGDQPSGAGLHLLIVGDGPQRKLLEELSRELKVSEAVTFTGAVAHHDVPAYLAAMDIAAAPYLANDNFYFSPLKVIEYLAMGKAIVAPRLGQIPALLQGKGGLCGLLYSPDNQEELTAALRRLIQDTKLRQRLGVSAAAQAHHTSWQSIAQKIIEYATSEPVPVPSKVAVI